MKTAAMRYQTHRPTIALALRDDHLAAVTIPAGKLMNIVGEGEDARFLVVEVDGEQLQIFESDLIDRCRAPRERGKQSATRSAGA